MKNVIITTKTENAMTKHEVGDMKLKIDYNLKNSLISKKHPKNNLYLVFS